MFADYGCHDGFENRITFSQGREVLSFCGKRNHELRSFRQRLVRQRLRSIHQRAKSLRQRTTGQFANVRYLSSTNENKAAYWCLECNHDPLVILGSRNFKSVPVSLDWLLINLHVFDDFTRWLESRPGAHHLSRLVSLLNTDESPAASNSVIMPITMWINIITFPFFRSKQSLFLHFDLVRNKMERTQVNNNSNFITIHSMKYLQAQKTEYPKNLWNLFTAPDWNQTILIRNQFILFTEMF